MDFIKWAALVLVLLIIFGGVVLWKLLSKEPAKNGVVAKRELQAFTLLHDGDLGTPSGSPASVEIDQNIRDLTGRYLFVNVKQGAEVKGEMVASKHVTSLMANAVAVSIPASLATSVGGQLRVGDLVDLVAVPKQGGGARSFENLVVLNIVVNKDANSNAITLAVPSSQRDDFASAVVGAELLVTRKFIAPN